MQTAGAQYTGLLVSITDDVSKTVFSLGSVIPLCSRHAAVQTAQMPGRARNERSLTCQSLSGLALWLPSPACGSQPHLHLHAPPCVCSHHGISPPWPSWAPPTAFVCWWTTFFCCCWRIRTWFCTLVGRGPGREARASFPRSPAHPCGTLSPNHTACSTALTQLSFWGVHPMTFLELLTHQGWTGSEYHDIM